jgi:hypothetical protein
MICIVTLSESTIKSHKTFYMTFSSEVFSLRAQLRLHDKKETYLYTSKAAL